MGDMADDAMAQDLMRQAEYEAEQGALQEIANEMWEHYLVGVCQWSTKDDEKILVQKMTELHIKYTLNMLNRFSKSGLDDPRRDMWIKILNYELEKRTLK